MPTFRWRHCAALALGLAAGCANLEARKVPLADRLAGADQKYKGFRYYLPRPYVVVSQRVCVGHHVVTGKLMQQPNGTLFIETVNELGHRHYLDFHGADHTQRLETDRSLSYVYYEAAQDAQQKPADVKKKGGGTIIGTPDTSPPKKPSPEQGSGGGSALEESEPRVLPEAVQRAAALQPFRVSTADQVSVFLADAAKKDAPPKADPASPGPFQFITLPDFEEQMAVKDVNFAAKGKYELKFADGWQLRSVAGSWDATEVAVRALQVLSDAVSAAASVRAEQLNKLPVTTPKQTDPTVGGRLRQVLVVRVQATYVEPGVYKLLKASERSAPPGDGAPDTECALLADLGLPLVTEEQTYILQP